LFRERSWRRQRGEVGGFEKSKRFLFSEVKKKQRFEVDPGFRARS
jgi:hypothetical protein